MSKKIFTSFILGALFLNLFFPKTTLAFWPFGGGNSSNSSLPPLIQKIIDKFKLNSDEVKQVVDEERTERQRERQAKYEEWLDILVKAGKINETQKQLILQKREELQNQQQTAWQQRETQRQALENWAKENNLDPEYLFGGFGRFSRGMKGWWR